MNASDVETFRDGTEDDEEEKLVRQVFRDFNVCRQNKSSFTIFIENDFSFVWDTVLENKYGKALNKGIHGFHWTIQNYSFEDLSNSIIFIRKYHEPKNDKTSKLISKVISLLQLHM